MRPPQQSAIPHSPLRVLQVRPGATSRNRLGFRKLRDAVTDPYVTVETVRTDTGSIGQHTFPVLKNSPTPLWDAKCMLIAKKGSTEGIAFRMLDDDGTKDDILLEITLARDDLPDVVSIQTAEWKTFVKTSTSGQTQALTLSLKSWSRTVPLVWSPRNRPRRCVRIPTDSPILKR
jgi:hypothetical protein